MGLKFFQTVIVARNLPGALLLPYLNGVLDGVIGAVGLVIFKNHPIIGGLMFGYAVISSTVIVALASRKR